ncbi:MAG: cytochrome c biogenesis protein ResB [Candidatus Eremiobacteraeota bacterium]|nr:cytochrome c biogenesis protein ResB [Candidatus Eremiobacteraeota bacterium]
MKKNKVFRFLASLKLAVILLVALAAILATATYYESIYDAKTAQHLVYGSPAFAAFLALLGVNVFCSAAIRYPYKPHQTGFVVTHVGIIIILLGSLVTMAKGVDGTMALEEGQSGKRVTLDEPILYFGAGREQIREIPAEFRWNPPRPDRPVRYPLAEGLTAVVDDYYHHSVEEINYVADQKGVPAVKVRLSNSRVDVSQWMTISDGRLSMGPATLQMLRLHPEEVKPFLAGEAGAADHGQLQILVGDKPFTLQVRDLSQTPTPVGDSGVSVRLIRYLAHAVVDGDNLISRSDEPVNPTLELEVHQGESMQRWYLFARMPELNTRTASQGDEIPVRLLYSMDPPSKRSLELAVADDQVYYRVDGQRTGQVKVGQTIATGWMDLQFQLQDFLPQARREKLYREFKPKKSNQKEGPPPAVRVTVEGAPEPGPYWLQRGDIIQLPAPPGYQENLVLGYGLRTVPLNFEIKLKDFEVGFDPGTRTAASYKSIIEVDGNEHVVQMNEPFHRDGYNVFQASFGDGPGGESTVSVFSIARDPGIFLKYLGSILLVLGIIIMFYIKPYMLKKKKSEAKE